MASSHAVEIMTAEEGKTMAEPHETQQEKETRWTAQRAAHDTQQTAYRGGEDTENREKLVDRGSHSDPRAVIAAAVLL